MKHPVRNAGLGLAFLYMTVLGFDSITWSYCLLQVHIHYKKKCEFPRFHLNTKSLPNDTDHGQKPPKNSSRGWDFILNQYFLGGLRVNSGPPHGRVCSDWIGRGSHISSGKVRKISAFHISCNYNEQNMYFFHTEKMNCFSSPLQSKATFQSPFSSASPPLLGRCNIKRV